MKRIMSKEEFLSVYERQQASGLTIKDFCENEAYSSSCFHYWKKEIQPEPYLHQPYGQAS